MLLQKIGVSQYTTRFSLMEYEAELQKTKLHNQNFDWRPIRTTKMVDLRHFRYYTFIYTGL